MVFSAVPLYLDHPNWHHQLQQPNYQPSSEANSLQPSLPPAGAGGGGSSGSIRPGSMSDRARLAKIPQPEPGLKCPRCESTNTKFCYFNNYSLTQPRHFCKTCRRYWTRGGALRNVPVGGGCRRNKKSKSSGSKSQAIASTEQQATAAQASASPSSCSTDMSAHFPHPSPQLPFIAALQNLVQYGGGNMGGFQPQMAAAGGGGLTDVGFQMGNICTNSGGSGGADHWRLPILGGFDSPNNLYPYDQSEGVEAPITSMLAQSHLGRSTTLSSAMSTQLPPVKMEENQGLNFSRHLARAPQINQYWGGNPWTEFSSLNSSSQ